MPKDAKGHGSNAKGWGHAQHFAESQRLGKASASLRATDPKKATDLRAKANEHAANAKHLLISEKRRAAGATPAHKMATVKATTKNRKY